jgi:uncharacterized protein (DUF302 family)
MNRLTFAALSLSMLAAPLAADELVTMSSPGDFASTAFAVESAIVARGLVIDYVSHVGDMLERTRADVGSDVVIFDNAQIFLFCSASLSRQVMEADPMNIAYCPYAVHVIERDGEVVVAYAARGVDSMAPVNALLNEIAAEAVE